MQLGIDLGTTRTVVAVADRGNYPVVEFSDSLGDWHDHVPSLSALVGQHLVHGFDAVAAVERGAVAIRSVKRELTRGDLTLDSTLQVGGRTVRLLDVVCGQLTTLRLALTESSTVAGQQLGTVVAGVPAHARSAQRLFTLEAFRRAGFHVSALVNEPSAAGFEYSHRQARTLNSRRSQVLVYDLGGGTFDASLVQATGGEHRVLATVGLNRLGGDDLDRVLAGCVLSHLAERSSGVATLDDPELLEACRAAKEQITPQRRKVSVEYDDDLVQVPVAEFYQAAAPLVEQTLEVMAPLVDGLDLADSEVAGIYTVGGSSSLPLVSRVLRERFGRRVHRSPYPGASTAIGLAIAADRHSGVSLTDLLSRGFGVFREGQEGREVRFDEIFSPEQVVRPGEQVSVTRRYRPEHNVGWFRMVEYTGLDEYYQPLGEIQVRGELLVPFDPQLRGRDDLAQVPVRRMAPGALVEEEYLVDEHGAIQVRVTELDTGYQVAGTLA